MTFKSLSILTFMTATLVAAIPASAASQSDVTTCRAAITSQSNVDMNQYRLRFMHETGVRNRTLYMKALSTSGAPSFTFECYINRDQTPTVKLSEKTRFAKMK